MSLDPSAHEIQPVDDDWQEIDQLVDDVARLAATDLTTRQFHEGLLQRAVRGLAAVGGAVWIRNPAGQIQLDCQVNLDSLPLAENWADAQRHTRLLDVVLSGGESRVVAPLANLTGETQTANPTNFLLLLAPLRVETGAHGLIEVFQRPNVAPGAERGYVRFLATLGELAADFQRNQLLRQFHDREALWGRFQHFVEQAHASLDLRTTAYTIANEGRGLIDCDRLSVGVLDGRKCRLLAASGVDRFDRRAQSVRLMEQLTAAVATTDEPLWHDDVQATYPPQIEAPLQALLDETHARALAIVPLHGIADPAADEASDEIAHQSRRASEPMGVLIVERFDVGAFDPPQRQRIAAVARQSALALGNARKYQNVPFLPLLQGLGAMGWFVRATQLPKTIIALALAAVAVVALVLVPADFNVTARGRLQPKIRGEVFAPADGDVKLAKNVQQGDEVTKDAELGELRSRQLEAESSRVSGEIQVAQERLRSVQSSKSTINRENRNETEKPKQLAAEEGELTALLDSLNKQKKILDAQQADLRLRSPLTGTVLTWDVEKLLANRPVARGQSLLTVADLKGDWVVEVPVPDNQIGHVLTAQEQNRPPSSNTQRAEQTRKPGRDVSFILATEPGTTHEGTVERVALAADTDKTTGTTVMVTVDFKRSSIPADELRPGATVTARIYCGRRSIGYVWLHELWETIQSKVLF